MVKEQYILLFANRIPVILYLPEFKIQKCVINIGKFVFLCLWRADLHFLMIGSILVNYCLARLNTASRQWAKAVLILTVVFNIGLLVVFKYSALLVKTVGWLLGLLFAVPDIVLPIGISFYTFQALSYCVDVYRNRNTVQKNVWKLMPWF